MRHTKGEFLHPLLKERERERAYSYSENFLSSFGGQCIIFMNIHPTKEER
jgi:hypothetical protein